MEKCCSNCEYDYKYGHEEPCKSCDVNLSNFKERTIIASMDVPKPSDNVNHPVHYQGANECIVVMEAMFGKQAVIDFCRCNAFKYRFRADKKNGKEDIKKAEWYETKILEMLSGE